MFPLIFTPKNTQNSQKPPSMKTHQFLRCIQEGFEGSLLGSFSGQVGSDSGGLPDCNSDCRIVTSDFGF